MKIYIYIWYPPKKSLPYLFHGQRRYHIYWNVSTYLNIYICLCIFSVIKITKDFLGLSRIFRFFHFYLCRSPGILFFLWTAISWEATMPGFSKTLLLQTLQKNKHSGFWPFFTNESLPKSWLKKERAPFKGEEYYQIRVWSERGGLFFKKDFDWSGRVPQKRLRRKKKNSELWELL